MYTEKCSRQGRGASLWLEIGSVITLEISLSKTRLDRSEGKIKKKGGGGFLSTHFEPWLLRFADQLNALNSPWEQASNLNMFGILLSPWSQGHPVLMAYWLSLMCSVSVIIKWFLCSSVGVISPQDAVTAERDVIENYHLHRPQALECSLAGSLVSLQEAMEGGLRKAQSES